MRPFERGALFVATDSSPCNGLLPPSPIQPTIHVLGILLSTRLSLAIFIPVPSGVSLLKSCRLNVPFVPVPPSIAPESAKQSAASTTQAVCVTSIPKSDFYLFNALPPPPPPLPKSIYIHSEQQQHFCFVGTRTDGFLIHSLSVNRTRFRAQLMD